MHRQLLRRWIALQLGISQQVCGREQHLHRYATRTNTSIFSSIPNAMASTGPPAFVFDIDGVLIRGKNVLASAKSAMALLTTSNRQQWRYPVCFMTNGGGETEAAKAQQLSDWLHVPVHADQVVLSHTPMRSLVGQFADRPVLVSGRKDVLHVAHSYGFNKVLTTQQLGQGTGPASTPFSSYPAQQASPRHQQHDKQHHKVSEPPQLCPVQDLGYGTDDDPIAAVMVMTDPSDWYRDLQLITDVLLTKGVPTRLHAPESAAPVQLFFSNPDLLWANEFPRPRFGQGAFSAALGTLHELLTGQTLQATWYGKPNAEPYRLAKHLLLQQAHQLFGSSAAPASALEAFCAIFMVGDNPAADVRGANRAGAPWVPVLVRTGVYREGQQLQLGDVPQAVVDDVEGAVKAGLHRYRQAKWHVHR